ncbi:MAG: pyruvate/2-oxoglutarate dehydrogenase complex dihydrolipoamide acyltransferase (E2) component [Cyclobacteriaceae bacterium]|jgi:pyruvate/2-oxoglutarate dehydrogenase complex dihydrolipoamide acyltransferase (E2) component
MPSHSIIPFSLERKQITDFLAIAKAKHTAYAVLELDITGIRNNLRSASRKSKKATSLTGYLLYCFAQAVNEDKMIQAYRKGNKLIIFDDVDVSTMVERNINGVLVPVSYVLRKANYKSVFEISEEIKTAKTGTSDDLMDSDSMSKKKKLIGVIKRIGFLRRWFLKRIFNDPFLKKEFNGTVGFSSMGMFSYNMAGWVVPMTPQVLTAMVGGVREVAGIVHGEIVKQEVVDLTIAMDHDILDGAQTARFIERFRKILLNGIEIDETWEKNKWESKETLEMSMTSK